MCGEGQREVQADQCPGPLAGKPLGAVSCAAYSAARGGPEFKLCRSNFIDGGFLDDAPMGLPVEQAEAFGAPRTLRSLSVLLIDPDIHQVVDHRHRVAESLNGPSGAGGGSNRGRRIRRASSGWPRPSPRGTGI